MIGVGQMRDLKSYENRVAGSDGLEMKLHSTMIIRVLGQTSYF